MSERLLVRLPNPIGDVVAAAALLDALRAGLPNTHLAVAGRAGATALLGGHPALNEAITVDKQNEADALRASQVDTALLLPNSWSSAIAAWRARIPRRIGRRGNGRGLLLHDALPQIAKPEPMRILYLELLAPLGLAAADNTARLFVTDAEKEAASKRLASAQDLGGEAPLVAVAPGAAFGPSKIYPPPQLSQALNALHDATGATFLLLGGPGEEELLSTVAAGLQAPHLSTHDNLAGLGEMKALLEHCQLLITMDTGARHIAAALGVPQVVLYGPTDPRWSADLLGQTTKVMRGNIECMPCHKKVCPIDHPCMKRIEPAEVAAAAVNRLASAVSK